MEANGKSDPLIGTGPTRASSASLCWNELMCLSACSRLLLLVCECLVRARQGRASPDVGTLHASGTHVFGHAVAAWDGLRWWCRGTVWLSRGGEFFDDDKFVIDAAFSWGKILNHAMEVGGHMWSAVGNFNLQWLINPVRFKHAGYDDEI